MEGGGGARELRICISAATSAPVPRHSRNKHHNLERCKLDEGLKRRQHGPRGHVKQQQRIQGAGVRHVVHDEPDDSKLAALQNVVSRFGYKFLLLFGNDGVIFNLLHPIRTRKL